MHALSIVHYTCRRGDAPSTMQHQKENQFLAQKKDAPIIMHSGPAERGFFNDLQNYLGVLQWKLEQGGVEVEGN